MLVAAAKRGDLIVRDHCGLSGTAEQVVAQAKKDGIYSECHTMAGEFDEDATLALCLHVIVKDLNSWGEENGNTFAINEDGVEWIDERGVMKAGRQLVEGGAVAKVPAPPAGVELEQKPRAIARSETQAGRLDEWLSECERRAKEKGLPFDREYMPGSKKDLLKLLHALDPELRSIKMVGSLDNHLDRLERRCRWSLKASAMESAMGLYQELFPEAMLRARGNSAST